MKSIIAAIAVVAFVAALAPAQDSTLVGSWPAKGGNFTITSVGGEVNASGLNFTSSNHGLIPIPSGGSPAPFNFLLANNVDQVRLGNLVGRVSIDGTLELGVGALADAKVKASWDDGSRPVPFEIHPLTVIDPGDVNLPEPAGWQLIAFTAIPLAGWMRRRR